MSHTFSAIVVVALLGVAMANPAHHEILPHRGDAVSTTGSVNAASGYVGPSYSSALHSAPLAEGTHWQTNTIWWVGVGTANSVEVDLGHYVCDVSEIVLQADVNDNSYVDYWANGQWNPIQFGACAPGSSICSNTGGGMRTKTVTGLSLTGVSKFRTYALAGDPNIAVSRLNAKGLCTPTGILPASSETVSVTGTVNGAAPYTGAGSASALHQAMLAEGHHWETNTVSWSGTGSARSVVVDLEGTCSITKMILQADNNDQFNVDYWANGQWNAIPFGYCRTIDNRPGICTSYGGGMRTITKDNLNVAGATRLRTYCTAGDNLCSVSRLFAFGACVPDTHDPAVAAFCDNIEANCNVMDAECLNIRNGHGPLLGAGSMSNQAGSTGNGEPTGSVTLTGNSVVVTATGNLNCGAGCPNTPDGSGTPGNGNFLLPGASQHSLLARIGAGPWQFIGAGPTTLTGTGALTFAFNDQNGGYGDNSGSWFITIREDITNVADDCDASVVACHDVVTDCRDKAASCPLV